MLSRVADAFYWMSRYLERAEHSARVLDVYLSMTLDGDDQMSLQRLLTSVGVSPGGYGTLAPPAPGGSLPRVDPAHRQAVMLCIVAARENARQGREQISSAMWEQLNRLYLLVREAEHAPSWGDEDAFVRSVVEGAHLFQGLTDATLSHNEGWHFIQIGRFIERATTTSAMLEAHFLNHEPAETPRDTAEYAEWVAFLRSCAAFEAYCRHYTADLRPARIAEFLLLNPEFPRSVRFAVDRIEGSLRAVARGIGRTAGGRPERFAGRVRAALDYSQIDEIMADSLIRYLQSVRKQCEQVHGALYQTYITYSVASAIAS